MSRWPNWRQLLGGEQLPEGFAGRLDAEERVLASAEVAGGGFLVLTSYGLWLPDGRRIGWHQVSKATWGGGALTLVEAEGEAVAEDVVLLRDLPARRFQLASPGPVPEIVHKRVTSSIRFRHRRELPGGGAWFVQRSVAGRDGLLLQVRADPDTDPAAVRRVATQVAGKLKGVGK
ncbi:MAG TPA: hypothetical protein VK735_11695 [Pseudonocardia sp.]|uniref:hypothetical protein n=1 Tax=Pseudonocardia sp. TaxID=60912 RepID=UPI002CADC369|nr:hypothetical protein [Pseudonocardia sp.]HTF48104.1 hypothetical protein [Pseudonocardia sp.]